MLCHIYQATFQEVRYLGLSGSRCGKAREIYLAELADSQARDGTRTRAMLTLTQEEIAEMLGSSRETVTRIFASFKRKNLIEIHGSSLLIKDKPGLQALIEA